MHAMPAFRALPHGTHCLRGVESNNYDENSHRRLVDAHHPHLVKLLYQDDIVWNVGEFPAFARSMQIHIRVIRAFASRGIMDRHDTIEIGGLRGNELGHMLNSRHTN